MVGLLGAPASPGAPGVARGDELSDAKAKQAQLKKDIAAQKAEVAQLNALQTDLAAGIRQTADQLKGINTDLASVKVKISNMAAKINVIKADYDGLVAQLKTLDAQVVDIEQQEAAKRTQLAERKALLADRLRSAYDTDRTSLLETFLSGGTFTDLLAEMSAYIDVGEQDKALAIQVAKDQETLAELHQTTLDARSRTDDLRQQTAASKRALDKSLAALKDAKAALKKLEKRVSIALAQQKRDYARLAANKAAAKRAIAGATAAQKKLKGQIAALIRKQMQGGNIPSQYNGTLSWPMAGDVTQNFGCTGFCVGAADGLVRPLPQRHRHGRSVWHAGAAHPAPGPSSTSAGTTPTAPTRPGSSSSPTARVSRPGTRTCSRATPVGSTPAVTSRGVN